MRKAIVSGALANKPHNAGGAWERMSYAAGLRRLGYDVLFVEQIDAAAMAPAAADWFRDAVRWFGFSDRAALLDPVSDWSVGMTRRLVAEFARDCDLLFNLSGHLTIPEIVESVRLRVFIDVDPGFTQIWHIEGTRIISPHDAYFTIGENIGTIRCSIPTGGIPWQATRQPLLLNLWPVMASPANRRFTTISSWRGSFGAVAWNGSSFGLKVHEFRKMISLPRRVDAEFEIALSIHDGDAKDKIALQENGWRIVPPNSTVDTLESFRSYIQHSSAEFSVAQSVYAHTASGWFSDRSTRYLASGKPVLVQDTGSPLPAGEGLVTFRTLDDAIAGAESILNNSEAHSRAARRIAESHFDSDIVLRKLLHDIGAEAA